MKKKRNKESTINLLDLIPVQNAEWKKNEDGLIILLKPKLKHPFLRRHFLSHMKKPYFKIKLDDVGSYVWELCDGMRSVRDVADGLHNKFREKVDPLFDRLALFLQSLERNRLISFKTKGKIKIGDHP